MLVQRVLSLALDVDLTSPQIKTATQRWAATALKLSLIKKFIPNKVTSKVASQAAIDLFMTNNSSCESFELKGSKWIDATLIDEMRRSVYDFWHPKTDHLRLPIGSLPDFGRAMRPGPGASIGAVETDIFSKIYNGPLSATDEGLYDIYQHLVHCYPQESIAEQIRRNRFHSSDTLCVQGSHLSIVPKTTEIGRCICTEPSINMMLQLGLGTVLEKRLWQVFGIRLESQPIKNQALARMGSITGGFATIDLKSASDSISLTLLEHILPRDLLRWCKRFRSPKVRLPDGRWVDLHMVSTMGNGFTFPLQTMLFACVVQAVYRTLDIKLDTVSPNFGVFGDDIIVEKQAFQLVLRALELFGFNVNTDKTFNEGHFRESCGCDYLHGSPVRGVYVKRLDMQQDYYVAINMLNRWSALHDIPLPLTVGWLITQVRWMPVPLHESADSGIWVPSFLVKGRLNANGSNVYRAYTSEQRVYRPRDEENPSGLLSAALRGYVRNGKFIRRRHSRKYKLVTRVSPCWDFADGVGYKANLLGQRWETAVVFNLPG